MLSRIRGVIFQGQEVSLEREIRDGNGNVKAEKKVVAYYHPDPITRFKTRRRLGLKRGVGAVKKGMASCA